MSEQRPLDNDDRCAWVAYELHDGLVQWIVGARMTLENVRAKLPADLGPASEPLEQVQEMLESALDEGRRLIEFIEAESGRLDSLQSGPAVDEAAVDELSGLGSASSTLFNLLSDFVDLKQQAADTHSQQLSIDADESQWPRLLPRIAWNVLRVLQQAITNANNHAGPCRIYVDCQSDSQSHRFIVADDGQGFDVDQPQAKRHFGLQAMRHRASIIGGTLSINSTPGMGTRIELTLPIAAQ